MMILVAITSVSVVLAAVTSTVAWRLAREERRRSDARVAALAAEIPGDEGAEERGAAKQGGEAGGAGGAGRAGRARRVGLAIAIAVLLIAKFGASLVIFSGESTAAAASPRRAHAAARS